MLLKLVYALADQLPRFEEFNMKSQMKRAAVSVMLNIAEGSSKRSSVADRKRFYEIARSSAIEIDSQFEGSVALAFFTEGDCETANSVLMEVFRMLTKMIDG